jgi:hypothetical protein
MKKILSVVAMAAMFAACNGNSKTNTSTTGTGISQADTAGLKEFKDAKARQEIIQTEGVYNGVDSTASNMPANRLTNTNTVRGEEKSTMASNAGTVHHSHTTSTHHSSTAHSGGSGSSSGSTGSVGSTGSSGDTKVVTTDKKTVVKRKGWSKAAKGTAIGAGAGAVTGAIISKDKSKGAIIGGVVGAAGGYIIGRKKDKQDGRY